jgi:hypothetical protein
MMRVGGSLSDGCLLAWRTGNCAKRKMAAVRRGRGSTSCSAPDCCPVPVLASRTFAKTLAAGVLSFDMCMLFCVCCCVLLQV